MSNYLDIKYLDEYLDCLKRSNTSPEAIRRYEAVVHDFNNVCKQFKEDDEKKLKEIK
jgi:hypothetical protein